MYTTARVTVALVFTIVGMAAGASAVSAQGIGPSQLPRVGDRVRIIAPSLREDRFVGRVEGLPRDSILIDTAGVRRRLGSSSAITTVYMLVTTWRGGWLGCSSGVRGAPIGWRPYPLISDL